MLRHRTKDIIRSISRTDESVACADANGPFLVPDQTKKNTVSSTFAKGLLQLFRERTREI